MASAENKIESRREGKAVGGGKRGGCYVLTNWSVQLSDSLGVIKASHGNEKVTGEVQVRF